MTIEVISMICIYTSKNKFSNLILWLGAVS